jgi:hypothetical protein
MLLNSRKKWAKLTVLDNRYMEIMNIMVLYLSDIERERGGGVEREELIQWYLEQKEEEFESEEDLEYERELIGKALTKLAKVSTTHHLALDIIRDSYGGSDDGQQRAALTYRTTTCLSCAETCAKGSDRPRRRAWRRMGMTKRCTTLCIRRWICRI